MQRGEAACLAAGAAAQPYAGMQVQVPQYRI